MKRYHACHCPLARASILEGDPDISPTWCYCSGGFEKFQFDVIFDEDVGVEVLESALAGDQRCRFAVRIPEGKLKYAVYQAFSINSSPMTAARRGIRHSVGRFSDFYHQLWDRHVKPKGLCLALLFFEFMYRFQEVPVDLHV